MLSPNLENRTFFTDRLARHCGGDLRKAEAVDITVFYAAMRELNSQDEAERFLAGHLHWLRGKRPQTLESAFAIARANIHWCFAETDFPEKKLKLWAAIMEPPIFDSTAVSSPEKAFKASQLVGEKIKAGKDPGLLASLAKKALAKKGTQP